MISKSSLPILRFISPFPLPCSFWREARALPEVRDIPNKAGKCPAPFLFTCLNQKSRSNYLLGHKHTFCWLVYATSSTIVQEFVVVCDSQYSLCLGQYVHYLVNNCDHRCFYKPSKILQKAEKKRSFFALPTPSHNLWRRTLKYHWRSLDPLSWSARRAEGVKYSKENLIYERGQGFSKQHHYKPKDAINVFLLQERFPWSWLKFNSRRILTASHSLTQLTAKHKHSSLDWGLEMFSLAA